MCVATTVGRGAASRGTTSPRPTRTSSTCRGRAAGSRQLLLLPSSLLVVGVGAVVVVAGCGVAS